MTKIKHPSNRLERLKVREKKEELRTKDRSGKVRKLLVEKLKVEETANELRENGISVVG